MRKDIDELLLQSGFIKQKAYWLEKLSADFWPTRLLQVTDREPGRSGHTQSVGIAFAPDLNAGLLKLSKQSDLSLYIVLLTLAELLIYRYTFTYNYPRSGGDLQDICVISPLYRPNIHKETFNRLLFINNGVNEQGSFIDLLLKVRQSVLEAYENQDYPFDTLIRSLFRLQADEPVGSRLLTNVVCTLDNIHVPVIPDEDEEWQGKIIFSFSNQDGQITGQILYNSEMYHPSIIERLAAHFTTLAHSVLRDVRGDVSGIALLSQSEKKELIDEVNCTDVKFPGELTLHQLIDRQVVRTPEHVAAAEQTGRHIPYRELAHNATVLARVLREKGVGPGTLVALIADRSIELLTGILAVLKAGGGFLPIDSNYPKARKSLMLNESQAPVLLTHRNFDEFDSSDAGGILMDTVLYLEDYTGIEQEQDGRGDEDIENVNAPEDTAYAIFTSGTTGKPKGVLLTHRGAVNYIWWAAATYVGQREVAFPLFTSISFDLTITSLFTPLVTGNRIEIYGQEDNPFLIRDIIEDNRVEAIKLTPSHLKLIRDQRISDDCRIQRFIVGGEQLETRLALDIHNKFQGKIELYNEYGPTETVVGSMIHRFDPGQDSGVSVPIGKPIANTRIYILDRKFRPLPPGVPGELMISGVGVARGYLHEETAPDGEKFIPDPFCAGERMYKTGDLVMRLPQGDVEFLGRMDNQVKIRGFRIEPGEIESRLSQHEQVKEAVVLLHREGNPEQDEQQVFLAAYVVPAEADYPISSIELRNYLSIYFSAPVIPSYFVPLSCLPLTPNGKLDRSALPDPREVMTDENHTPPENDVEEKLVEIWADVLELPPDGISVTANFFEIGGHSLKAGILIARMHREFHVELPLGRFFRQPSIRACCACIKEAETSIYQDIKPVEERAYYPQSSAQKRLFFLDRLENIGSSYNISTALWVEGNLDFHRFEQALNALVQRHESLRTSFCLKNQQPVQCIHDNIRIAVKTIDCPIENAHEQVQEAVSYGKEIVTSFIRPFDLSQSPLLRVALASLGMEKYLLIYDMHHIIGDGASMGILVEDFIRLYDEEELPPLKVQYKDFACWQIDLVQSETIRQQEKYWLNRFPEASPGKGSIPRLNLPTDFPRPEKLNFEGDTYEFRLGPEQTLTFKELARETGVTLYMNLLAAFYVLLFKYTGQEDIVVGSVVAGRPHNDLQSIIGFFVNTLALRNFPGEEKSYAQFLEEVKAHTLEAFENQDMQFEEMVEKLKLERDPSRNPLFDVLFILQNFQQARIDYQKFRGVQFLPFEFKNPTAKFDIHFAAMEIGDEIFLGIEYAVSLFKSSSIRLMADHYLEIINRVNRDKHVKLKDITLSHDIIELQTEISDDDRKEFIL